LSNQKKTIDFTNNITKMLILAIIILSTLVMQISSNEPIFTSLNRHQVGNFNQTTKTIYAENKSGFIQQTVFPLNGCSAIGFTVPVLLGDVQEEALQLIVDTGSSTLGAASIFCDSSCDSLSPLYTPSASASLKGSTTATYGSGATWSGKVFYDTMQIGNTTVPPGDYAQQTTMRFAAITTSAGFFSSANCFLESSSNAFQGIMGMAFPALTTENTDAAIDALNLNEFTLQLCMTGGNMWMRLYDSRFISGPFQYTPIVSDSFYLVQLSNISLNNASNGNSLNLVLNVPTSAIVDSGTTQLLLPQSMFNSFVSTIYNNVAFQMAFNSNSNFFTNGECLTTSWTTSQLNAALPFWSVGFTNGIELSKILPVESYLLTYLFDDSILVYCPGVAAISETSTMILGFSFLNQFTTRFDIIDNQIGFAPTANCGVQASAFPYWAVSDWSQCNSTQCSGDGIQFATNMTCTYPNLTATTTNLPCANQSLPIKRFCEDPIRLNSCKSGGISILTIDLIIAIVVIFLAVLGVAFVTYSLLYSNRVVSEVASRNRRRR
jgi:hypothetical protein